MADKKLRLSTLRILSHYETFPIPEAKSMERPETKRKVVGRKTCDEVSNSYSKVCVAILFQYFVIQDFIVLGNVEDSKFQTYPSIWYHRLYSNCLLLKHLLCPLILTDK
jgi:hypothetical protein